MSMKWRGVAIVIAGLGAAPALAADPFASEWADSAKSRARLIADGAGRAGLEIELAPGAITYWRDPGESGVPPTFDFGGSSNLADAGVVYPAPTRIPEPDGSTANGYREQVIFPIRIAAKDSAAPVVLKLNVNYAVCEKLCLPARAALSLELPNGVSGSHGPALASALDLAPRAAAFADLGGEVKATDARNWRLCFASVGAARRELFVEAPPGAWLEAKAVAATPGRECYALNLQQPPLDPKPPLYVKATLTGGDGPKETSFELPQR